MKEKLSDKAIATMAEAAKEEDMRQDLIPSYLQPLAGKRLHTNVEWEKVRSMESIEVEQVRYRSTSMYECAPQIQAILGAIGHGLRTYARHTWDLEHMSVNPGSAVVDPAKFLLDAHKRSLGVTLLKEDSSAGKCLRGEYEKLLSQFPLSTLKKSEKVNSRELLEKLELLFNWSPNTVVKLTNLIVILIHGCLSKFNHEALPVLSLASVELFGTWRGSRRRW